MIRNIDADPPVQDRNLFSETKWLFAFAGFLVICGVLYGGYLMSFDPKGKKEPYTIFADTCRTMVEGQTPWGVVTEIGETLGVSPGTEYELLRQSIKVRLVDPAGGQVGSEICAQANKIKVIVTYNGINLSDLKESAK